MRNAKETLERFDQSKMQWVLYLLFLFAFEPKLFVKFPLFNLAYIAGALFSFLYLAFFYLADRRRPSLLLVLLVLYRLSFGVQTLIGGGDFLMWGYLSLVLVTLLLTFERYMPRDPLLVIRALLDVFLLLLTLHFVGGLVSKDGIVGDLGFLGVRTRLSDVIFPAIALTFVYDHMKGRILSLRTLYTVFLSGILLVYFNVMTALLGLLAIFGIRAFLRLFRNKDLSRIFHVVSVLFVGFLMNALLVFGRITMYMGWIFEKIFHRDPTISFRTGIWDAAIPLILERPLFGYGMADNGNFAPITNGLGEPELWQAHNQWLQILYDGGLVTAILFVLLIELCFLSIWKRSDKTVAVWMLSALSAFVIMMTVEIFSYTPYFFAFLFAAYYASFYRAGGEEKKFFLSRSIRRLRHKGGKI